jgi:hypothetical protein
LLIQGWRRQGTAVQLPALQNIPVGQAP